MGAY